MVLGANAWNQASSGRQAAKAGPPPAQMSGTAEQKAIGHKKTLLNGRTIKGPKSVSILRKGHDLLFTVSTR